MPAGLTSLLQDCLINLVGTVEALVWPALVFAALALAAKGWTALSVKPALARETSFNLTICLVDAALIATPLMVLLTLVEGVMAERGWRVLTPTDWDRLPSWAVVAATLFAGDFAGYWRHRLEHTRWLWPAHAVHHSDTEMTWLAIFRFHPVNRITTAVLDSAFLVALGFPPAAIVINALARHYYGQFIHADLPWTLGPLRFVLVSPAMHRWHHADDPAAYGTNFATLFSVFDRVFGTLRVPGPCNAPLGVSRPMGQGALAQLAYPFRPSAYAQPASAGVGAEEPLPRSSAPSSA